MEVLFIQRSAQRAAFQYGMQVAPDDDMLYLNLARVWVTRGDRDRARIVMRQLLERKPGNGVATKALKALDTP